MLFMITIKLFALVKDKAGRSELSIAFTGETVADLLEQVSREHPALTDILACRGDTGLREPGVREAGIAG